MQRGSTDRGQAFTLEGVVAGLIILVSLLFALQGVAVTPGAPGADVEPELRQQTVDLLDLAEETGALDEMVRYFDNESGSGFYNATDTTVGYGSTVPDTDFGQLVEAAFHERGKVVNVILEYPREDDLGTAKTRLIYQGEPPSASTVATSTVTLYSNQTLTAPGGEETTLAEAVAVGEYPIPDIDPGGPLHNVVHIRVVVW